MHPRFLSLLVLLAAAMSGVSAANQPVIRVLCYNIHHGEGIDQQFDLGRIAKLILDAQADIVALQEVDRGCERTAGRDLPAELAQLTGMTVHFARNIDFQGGEYGNAVLTRFPIRNAKNTHLPMLRAGEQRGALQLVLDVHGREILFVNTHLDHRPDEAERLASARELKRIVTAAGSIPVILAGDFNTLPGSRTHEKLKSILSDTWEAVGEGDGFTAPTVKPAKRIDYVWISPDFIEPIRAHVLSSIASDHLPLVVELRLK